MDDINKDIINILDTPYDGKEFIFDEQKKADIKIAANKLRDTKIYETAYNKRKSNGAEEWYNQSANDIYTAMISKIVDAPTEFHKIGVPILMIPVLDDVLSGRTEMTPPSGESDEQGEV